MVHVKEVAWGSFLPDAGSVGPVATPRGKVVPRSELNNRSFVASNGSVLYARAPQRPSLAGSGVPVRQDTANASLSV